MFRYGRPGLSLPGNGLLSILSFQIKSYFLSWRHCPAGTPSDGLHILERGCVSVSLAFGASRGERLYFLLGRVRSACRHDVPFAKRPLLTKNLHRQVCPLDPLEFPVLRLPRRKRLREMDNLSDPLSACDLSTGNRALSLCVYRLFPFLPLRSREMDGLFLSGFGTFTCARRGPQGP